MFSDYLRRFATVYDSRDTTKQFAADRGRLRQFRQPASFEAHGEAGSGT
jgi:hypothetical protein